jgi:hypothetical protein
VKRSVSGTAEHTGWTYFKREHHGVGFEAHPFFIILGFF